MDWAIHSSVSPSVLRSPGVKQKRKRGSWTPGAVCVSDCFVWVCESVQYVFVGLCMCAFTSGGVCSVWATLTTVWAQVFLTSPRFFFLFFFKFSPWKRNKRLFEWRFLFLSGKYPRGSFLKKCKIPDHVIIKTYTNHRGDWITPTRLPEW